MRSALVTGTACHLSAQWHARSRQPSTSNYYTTYRPFSLSACNAITYYLIMQVPRSIEGRLCLCINCFDCALKINIITKNKIY